MKISFLKKQGALQIFQEKTKMNTGKTWTEERKEVH